MSYGLIDFSDKETKDFTYSLPRPIFNMITNSIERFINEVEHKVNPYSTAQAKWNIALKGGEYLRMEYKVRFGVQPYVIIEKCAYMTMDQFLDQMNEDKKLSKQGYIEY